MAFTFHRIIITITTVIHMGILTEPFMQRALLAALALAPLSAILGVFVTARRMAFFSDTISHGALAGIAVGFWWGLAEPMWPMIGFSLLVAVGTMWLKENTDLLTDTIMALFLSGSVAFGITILSLLKGYQGEIHRYLFGDILAISRTEVIWAAGLAVVVGAWVFRNLSYLALLTAQEELAHVCGVPVRRLNYLFVIALTLVVAMSIRLIGIILVTALLVIPAATGRILSRNLRQQIISSVVVGLLGGIGGTLMSFYGDVPCGPAIVLACIGLFLCSLVVARFK